MGLSVCLFLPVAIMLLSHQATPYRTADSCSTHSTPKKTSSAVCSAAFLYIYGCGCVRPLQFIVQINTQVLGISISFPWIFTGVGECSHFQRSTTSKFGFLKFSWRWFLDYQSMWSLEHAILIRDEASNRDVRELPRIGCIGWIAMVSSWFHDLCSRTWGVGPHQKLQACHLWFRPIGIESKEMSKIKKVLTALWGERNLVGIGRWWCHFFCPGHTVHGYISRC